MRFNTPLRYPGGKAKLTNFVEELLRLNRFTSIHYAEPYAGGAGLALNLLMKGSAEVIYLNDINNAVYSFWYSVLNHCDELCSLIEDTGVTIDEWHRQKDIMSKQLDVTTLELGFSTFFLNRTNRSGILKGGVIGGKKQDGNWKLDARYNKKDLMDRIQKINKKSDSIFLTNMDAVDFLDYVVVKLSGDSLIYLDPPYYIKGQGLYENHYKHDDHTLISKKVISELNVPWIVSYDNVPQINDLYKSCKKMSYGINYSAQDRYLGSEVMFFSDGLKKPRVFK
ncbi:DNA adenine methylase [Salmonella enterica]|nr:DNA adenine methylase [Salmonella enterica]